MAQSTNMGLPLWGEIPPEGATGKTLRDAILGMGTDSMAQLLDAKAQIRANMATAANNDSIPADDSKYPSCQLVKQALEAGQGGVPLAYGDEIRVGIGSGYLYNQFEIEDSAGVLSYRLVKSSDAVLRCKKVKVTYKHDDFWWNKNWSSPFQDIQSGIYELEQSENGDYAVAFSGFPIICVLVVYSDTLAFPTWGGTTLNLTKGTYLGYFNHHVDPDTEYTVTADAVTPAEEAYDPQIMPDAVGELVNNRVTQINDSSDHRHYPTAQAVYDAMLVPAEPITWDGNTEGKTGIQGVLYCVSNHAAVVRDAVAVVAIGSGEEITIDGVFQNDLGEGNPLLANLYYLVWKELGIPLALVVTQATTIPGELATECGFGSTEIHLEAGTYLLAHPEGFYVQELRMRMTVQDAIGQLYQGMARLSEQLA